MSDPARRGYFGIPSLRPQPSRRLVAALLCLFAGCDDDARVEAVGCAFGDEHPIATAEGALFHDVELVGLGARAIVLFSDRSGSFARRVGPDGTPEAEVRQIGAPCPGGMAAAPDADAMVVACVRPADRDRAREGEVAILRVTDDAVERIASVGPAGAESFGVDVVTDGERVVVGWRDADVFTARTWLTELRDGAPVDAPRALSSFGPLASAPSLILDDGAWVAAWTESWFDPGGDPSGHLLVQREGGPPMPSLDVGDIDVRVHLTRDERGPMVSLRDRRPYGAAPRAFVGRLDERLALSERDLHLPGRADSHHGRPMLVPCGDHVFSVATRRSSREVTMVSLRRLDRDLRPVEDEQQIYEYHARFPQAVGACVSDRLLLAVGERQSETHATPRLRTYTLRCGPGVEHARTPSSERAGRR